MLRPDWYTSKVTVVFSDSRQDEYAETEYHSYGDARTRGAAYDLRDARITARERGTPVVGYSVCIRRNGAVVLFQDRLVHTLDDETWAWIDAEEDGRHTLGEAGIP